MDNKLLNIGLTSINQDNQTERCLKGARHARIRQVVIHLQTVTEI